MPCTEAGGHQLLCCMFSGGPVLPMDAPLIPPGTASHREAVCRTAPCTGEAVHACSEASGLLSGPPPPVAPTPPPPASHLIVGGQRGQQQPAHLALLRFGGSPRASSLWRSLLSAATCLCAVVAGAAGHAQKGPRGELQAQNPRHCSRAAHNSDRVLLIAARPC